MAVYNNQHAPIPGESLTHEPGGQPWEQPARFPNPQDAAEHIWKQLLQPKNTIQALKLMQAGIPASDMMRTTLMSGFGQGLWSVDTMVLIDRSVLGMYVAIAEKAGIKYQEMPPGPDDIDIFLDNINSSLKTLEQEHDTNPGDVQQALMGGGKDDANAGPGQPAQANPGPSASGKGGFFSPPGPGQPDQADVSQGGPNPAQNSAPNVPEGGA